VDDSVPDSYTPQPPASPVSEPSPSLEPTTLPSQSQDAKPTTTNKPEATGLLHTKAVFASPSLTLDLRYVTSAELENVDAPSLSLKPLDLANKGHKGTGVFVDLLLEETQVVTFVLRSPPEKAASELGQPTRMQADRLGVPFEGAFHILALIGSL
jgi:hypothetical protein